MGEVNGEQIVGITRYYVRKGDRVPAIVRHWTDKQRMKLYVTAMRRQKKAVSVTEYHVV